MKNIDRRFIVIMAASVLTGTVARAELQPESDREGAPLAGRSETQPVPDDGYYPSWRYVSRDGEVEAYDYASRANRRTPENPEREKNRSGRDRNLGWHYDWSPLGREWVRDYGWYSSFYDAEDGADARDEKANAVERKVEARIRDVRTLTLQNGKGEREKRTVVEGELRNGRRVLIDLGETSRNRHLEVQRGDWFRARGRIGLINGRRVLFADSITTKGDTTAIRRKVGTSGSADQSSIVAGKLLNAAKVHVNNTAGETVALVKITLDTGRELWIYPPENADAELLTEAEEQQVSVRGKKGEIAGREVIVASNVNVGEK